MSKPHPIITDVRYMTSHEYRGAIEIVHYVVETDVLWDSQTTITIRRQVERPRDADEAMKKRTYEAMRNSSERLAVSLLGAMNVMGDEGDQGH